MADGTPHATPLGEAIFGSRFSYTSSNRDAQELLTAYRKSPILQAVVRKIATAVASAAWTTEVNTADGWVEVDDHPMTLFLGRAGGRMSGMQVATLEVTHFLLTGESFSYIERGVADVPFQRYVIPPHWVRKIPSPFDPWFHVYPAGGGIVKIHELDMIWERQLDPLDPYARGTGVGGSLLDELKADEASAQHVAATLQNGALPSAIISGTKETPLLQADVLRLQGAFESRFGGPNRSGKNLYSGTPLNVDQLGHNFRELELTELRKFERDIVINAFGFPPELIGVLASSNRATIQAAEFLFTKHVVRPMLDLKRSILNTQLATQFDDDLRCSYEDPVDEDRDFNLRVAVARPAAFTDNELRDLGGREPLEDPAHDEPPAPPAAPPTPPPEKGGYSTRAPSAAQLRAAAAAALAAIDSNLFLDVLAASYRETIAAFGSDELKTLGMAIDFTLYDPEVVSFVQSNAANRSKLIVGTTRTNLQESLAAGVQGGENTDKLVKRIRALVGDADVVRAKTISRTEIVRASNYAADKVHRDVGIEEHEWLATQDGGVRSAHRALDGVAVAVGTPFTLGTQTAMYPGGFNVPALDINCRCGLIPLIDELDEARAAPLRYKAWRGLEDRRAPFESTLQAGCSAAFRKQAESAVQAFERVAAATPDDE
jgi:HK97 family phage portal protein